MIYFYVVFYSILACVFAYLGSKTISLRHIGKLLKQQREFLDKAGGLLAKPPSDIDPVELKEAKILLLKVHSYDESIEYLLDNL